jgi:hypothetical protein
MLLVTATAKLPTMAMIRRVGKIFIGDIKCWNLFVENKEILCKLYTVTGTVMMMLSKRYVESFGAARSVQKQRKMSGNNDE